MPDVGDAYGHVVNRGHEHAAFAVLKPAVPNLLNVVSPTPRLATEVENCLSVGTAGLPHSELEITLLLFLGSSSSFDIQFSHYTGID